MSWVGPDFLFGAKSGKNFGHDDETGFIIYIEYRKYNPKKGFGVGMEDGKKTILAVKGGIRIWRRI